MNEGFLNRHLVKLGTGALAPSFCEAEAITSDEFFKMSNFFNPRLQLCKHQ